MQLHGKGNHFTHISSSTGTQARFGVGIVPENCEATATIETDFSIPEFNFSSVFYEGYNVWDNGAPSTDSFDSRHSSELYTIKALEYLNDAQQEGKTWFLYLSYQGENTQIAIVVGNDVKHMRVMPLRFIFVNILQLSILLSRQKKYGWKLRNALHF